MPPRRQARIQSFGPEEPEPAPPAPPGEAPHARPVGEVVDRVNRRLADDPILADVWVKGEISGFRAASSGHWYFDLKDERALLSGAMFRGANRTVRFQPEDGMEVLARGRVSVYPARSTLQIVVEELRPVGRGELALAFEQLRRRLEAEGLFDPARKRSIPAFPRRVGIVTSLHAAALRDLVQVATTRHPGVQLLVANARVQGEGAAREIAAALARLERDASCDVVIVARGGGSVEDLWAFNEEALVRAVAASRIPVVSAVGHESDVTLCDLAADLRAATPSHAAEIVVPDAEALLDGLDGLESRAIACLDRLVPDLHQRLDDLMERGVDAARRTHQKERDLLAAHVARLHALSPLAVLARGYAVLQKDGRPVRRVEEAPEGSDVEIILQDGRLDATVTRTRKET